MTDRAKAIWLGILIANIFTAGVMLITKYAVEATLDMKGVLILSDFVLLPMLMGLINTFFWRKHKVTAGPCFGYGALNLLVGLSYSYFFMGEGYICLIIVAPLIYLVILLGIAVGKVLFKGRQTTLQISVVAAIASLIAINAITAQPGENQVTDRILIQAPPEVVWQNVTAFPAIDTKPDYWLFRIGLPSPVQSTAEGSYVGAARQCIFSNGIVFEEKIVEYELNRKLTFDITQMPNDPEILGHLELKRGQFILEDNGDGTTTLVGTSWYDLKVKPALYFDWWTQDIIRNVHLEVMDHMKQLAEQA
ncbi:SRPBCC family protein [Paenibacillus whitsoniae]|uniref:SRPBCC family protein n=1 Tax=Paenibacillus whitsoniae TaxID=2496558 RepID=A0A430JDS4_9BACL|nr:SRPBCC family protein [Paenibacillus whitsoniae]RTE09161.1 hypothetical protein EJQ19_13605 [Paenibacillus whitsoniae]